MSITVENNDVQNLQSPKKRKLEEAEIYDDTNIDVKIANIDEKIETLGEECDILNNRMRRILAEITMIRSGIAEFVVIKQEHSLSQLEEQMAALEPQKKIKDNELNSLYDKKKYIFQKMRNDAVSALNLSSEQKKNLSLILKSYVYYNDKKVDDFACVRLYETLKEIIQ